MDSDFAHPLDRMIHLEIAECFPGLRRMCSFSSTSSDVSTTSSFCYDMDFEALVDDLLSRDDYSPRSLQNLTTIFASPGQDHKPVMLKQLPRSSPELLHLLQLNYGKLRDDPWNTAPRILAAVERGDQVFLWFERLLPFNEPPLKTVANLVDFFRQCLEGLAFLHEQHIGHLHYSNPSTFMADIGTWHPTTFDRTLYPVRYYFTDLSKATHNASHARMKRDVQECGALMDEMLSNVPKAGLKMNGLVKAMKCGELGAEDARRRFEALCKSLPAFLFDMPVVGNLV